MNISLICIYPSVVCANCHALYKCMADNVCFSFCVCNVFVVLDHSAFGLGDVHGLGSECSFSPSANSTPISGESHFRFGSLGNFLSTPVPPSKLKGKTKAVAPSRVLTSAEHMAYLESKEEEKRLKNEEKEKRKREREAKRNLKLAEKKEREKRKLNPGTKKKGSSAGHTCVCTHYN